VSVFATPRYVLYALAACTLLSFSHARAQVGDGPRAYFPPPIDTNLLSVYGMRVEGNSTLASGVVVKAFDLKVDLAVLQYTRTKELFGRYVSLSAILPYGTIDPRLQVGSSSPDRKQTGWSDASLLMTVGLINLPPFNREEWVKFKPGFSAGGLIQLNLPTGKYDPDRLVNIGANRYSLRLGFVGSFVLGESLLDSRLTTFDVIPSVIFYGDNDEAFGGGTIEQSALFSLEGHVTHNFNKALWGSFDLLALSGGKTTTDDVSNDNKQESLALGATIGLNLSKQFAMKASYGKVVHRNDDGLDGDQFRLNLSYLF